MSAVTQQSVLNLSRNHVLLLFWTPERRSGTSCRYSFFSYGVCKKNVDNRCDFRAQSTAKCVCGPHWGRLQHSPHSNWFWV